MAVELMMGDNGNESFTTKAAENAVQEAASGLESIEKLIKLLSQTGQQYYSSSSSSSFRAKPSMEIERDYNAVAGIAISKFKRVISLLDQNRTGHARFRRAPLLPQQHQTQIQTQPLDVINFNATPLLHIPPTTTMTTTKTTVHGHKNGTIQRNDSSKVLNFSYSSAANSFTSSLTGDTGPKRRTLSSPAETFQIMNLSQVSSSGKPPLSSSSKRKCSSETLDSGNYGSSSSKKRKLRFKRVVRVPAISLSIADIPQDDYSWRKYGQKSIKGSPHPRGYYRCSSVRKCPALKRVERALDDPSMLVVTYEGEHNHSLALSASHS